MSAGGSHHVYNVSYRVRTFLIRVDPNIYSFQFNVNEEFYGGLENKHFHASIPTSVSLQELSTSDILKIQNIFVSGYESVIPESRKLLSDLLGHIRTEMNLRLFKNEKTQAYSSSCAGNKAKRSKKR